MKQSILYLDDETACLDIFQNVLNGDFEVRTAVTHEQARRLLAEHPSDIVVSDQLMPEMSGTEFLREVAEKYPASCRVLLTGNMAVGNVLREIGNGDIHFFLTKPWTIQEMRLMLERAGEYLNSRMEHNRLFI